MAHSSTVVVSGMKASESCRSKIRAKSRFANAALEPARAEPVSRAVMATVEKMAERMMTILGGV